MYISHYNFVFSADMPELTQMLIELLTTRSCLTYVDLR